MASYFTNDTATALRLFEGTHLNNDAYGYIFKNHLRMCVYTGEYRKAISMFESNNAAVRYDLDNFILGHIAVAYYKTGQKDFAEKLMNIIRLRSEKSPVGSPSYYMAIIYAEMGETDKSIQWVKKSYQDHEVELYFLNVEPLLISLHKDPRFREILSKIGFG